jgi:hypothetical protein
VKRQRPTPHGGPVLAPYTWDDQQDLTGPEDPTDSPGSSQAANKRENAPQDQAPFLKRCRNPDCQTFIIITPETITADLVTCPKCGARYNFITRVELVPEPGPEQDPEQGPERKPDNGGNI